MRSLSSMLLLSLLLLFYYAIVPPTLVIAEVQGRTCLTKACVRSANFILQSIDETADPCEDFFEFSCGTWLRNSIIGAEDGEISRFSELQATVDDRVRDLLESEKVSDDYSTKYGGNSEGSKYEKLKSLQAAKKFYQACNGDASDYGSKNDQQNVDVDQMTFDKEADDKKEEAMRVARMVLSIQSAGGWPLLKDTTQYNTTTTPNPNPNAMQMPTLKPIQNANGTVDLKSYLSGLQQNLDTSLFVNVYYDKDLEDSSKQVINIDQQDTGLPSLYFLKSKLPLVSEKAEAYYKLICTVAATLAKDIGIERWHHVTTDGIDYYSVCETDDQAVRKLIAFEMEIAKVMRPPEDQRKYDKIYKKFTRSQLSSKYPWLDWEKAGVNMTDPDKKVVVWSDDFFTNLPKILAKADPETIRNYLIWRAIFGKLEAINNEYSQAYTEYMNEMEGSLIPTPTWKSCLQATMENFGPPVSKLYAESYYNDTFQAKLKVVTTNLKNVLRKLINRRITDSTARRHATQKLNNMQGFYAYPDYYDNVNEFEKNFDGETFNKKDTYWDMVHGQSQFRYSRNSAHFRDYELASDFKGDPTKVNAEYSPIGNSLNVMLAIMQTPYYDADTLNAVNYGALGSILGHEISHGFDTSGRFFNPRGNLEFDKNGNVKKLWDDGIDSSQQKRINCFIDQYNKYHLISNTSDKVDGNLTINENIADNGGLAVAYEAYKELSSNEGKNEVELRLPGLEKFNSDQLFFLSYGSVRCGKFRPMPAKIQLLLDEHAPYRYRVIGPLSNLPAFAQAFKCPSNSTMNPSKKCSLM